MNIRQLNEAGLAMWNRKAKFWDALHGDGGNLFHRKLVEPSMLELLELRRGESVLDIGCGNGALARRLAAEGAAVTAVDFSGEMIKLAKARGCGSIEYRAVDATDESALLAMGEARFDAIVSSMTLMDLPTIKPFFAASKKLLRAGGRLVFATMHPAFNSNNPVFIHEKEDRDGLVGERYAVKIAHYLEMPPALGSGARDEPSPHYYYHRPLSALLGAAFEAGFALDGLLEPAFVPDDAEPGSDLSWTRFAQIPPVLTARLR